MSFNREAENKLKVYVGGLTPEISEADIRTHFAKVEREEEEDDFRPQQQLFFLLF